MKEITLPKASQLTSPNPVTVVCTQKLDGSTNLATVSWWTYLSYKPNMIAYAMAKTSYSGDMVRNSKKVIVPLQRLNFLGIDPAVGVGLDCHLIEIV